MVATLLGAGLGAGLWLLLVGIKPPAPSATVVLASLRSAPAGDALPQATIESRPAKWTERLGRPMLPVLSGLGLPTSRARQDLKILDCATDDLLAAQVTTGTAALLLGPLAGAWFAILGVPIPLPVVLGGTFIGAVVLFWVPVLLLAADAEKARIELRGALSLYLDLVGSVLAGGGGIEQSLSDAASIGDAPTYLRLREALAKSRLARKPIPDVLMELAERLDSTELRETSSTLRLAGTEGSRIKEALAAKASVLRIRRLAQVQEQAESATERAGLPISLMFVGFLVLIGVPAVAKVLVGLR